MKKLLVLGLISAGATLSFNACAQFQKPEAAIKYRQSALFIMGQHFGRLGAMVKGQIPFDASVAGNNADVVAFMSKLPWAGFGPDAQGGKAKPDIWKDQAKFKDLNEKLQAETAKLAAAAHSGNQDTFKAAFTATAGACKNCHDAFKSE